MKHFHDATTLAEGAAKLDPLAPTDRRRASPSTQKGDETLDALFHGKVKLFQSRRGYRFSLDALLLAHFVTLKARESAIDLGTGNGVIPLILARLHNDATITGVEIQPAMAERAARNVRLNRLESQIHIRLGDIREVDAIAPAASFDMAVCNPPYRRAASGRISPNDEKRIARHESRGALGDFLRAADFFLRARGRITVVYLAERAVDLFAAMRAARLEPKRLRMVHSFIDVDASLVLVEGIKGGRSGVKILPPLIVYGDGKNYSAEVAAMIAGDSATRALRQDDSNGS
jgi:tRNA1Val (adenine37-N6)-methyltransferase